MDQRFRFIEVRGEVPPVTLCRAVREGFSQTPKSVPTHFLYDQHGSELFEQITELPEYYPTRTERSIIESHAGEILEAAGENVTLIEFGSGSSTKTRLLIEAALHRQDELGYMPIDISFDFLKSSSLTLLGEYERLRVTAIGGEYFDAASNLPEAEGPRLILFLGSNIGNLTREEAVDFLARVSRRMKADDRLLVGLDLVKDPRILEAAYNDKQGITAQFNKNMLRRINRELDADFPVDQFEHSAPYDEVGARIEMRLYSRGQHKVCIEAVGRDYFFEDGEYIHTEWSHKYTPHSFGALCAPAGLHTEHLWTDEQDWFGLAMLKVG